MAIVSIIRAFFNRQSDTIVGIRNGEKPNRRQFLELGVTGASGGLLGLMGFKTAQVIHAPVEVKKTGDAPSIDNRIPLSLEAVAEELANKIVPDIFKQIGIKKDVLGDHINVFDNNYEILGCAMQKPIHLSDGRNSRNEDINIKEYDSLVWDPEQGISRGTKLLQNRDGFVAEGKTLDLRLGIKDFRSMNSGEEVYERFIATIVDKPDGSEPGGGITLAIKGVKLHGKELWLRVDYVLDHEKIKYDPNLPPNSIRNEVRSVLPKLVAYLEDRHALNPKLRETVLSKRRRGDDPSKLLPEEKLPVDGKVIDPKDKADKELKKTAREIAKDLTNSIEKEKPIKAKSVSVNEMFERLKRIKQALAQAGIEKEFSTNGNTTLGEAQTDGSSLVGPLGELGLAGPKKGPVGPVGPAGPFTGHVGVITGALNKDGAFTGKLATIKAPDLKVLPNPGPDSYYHQGFNIRNGTIYLVNKKEHDPILGDFAGLLWANDDTKTFADKEMVDGELRLKPDKKVLNAVVYSRGFGAEHITGKKDRIPPKEIQAKLYETKELEYGWSLRLAGSHEDAHYEFTSPKTGKSYRFIYEKLVLND